MGVGLGETLRWFEPIDDAATRRAGIEYLGRVLETGAFPSAAEWGLRAVQTRGASAASAGSDGPATPAGLVLLSHAETDLLAVERARADLPTEFPPLAAHSLLTLPDADALLSLFAGTRSTRLCVIVRIHGAVTSVPGLTDLLYLTHREGWSLVVISGVGGAAEALPRTGNPTAELASSTTPP